LILPCNELGCPGIITGVNIRSFFYPFNRRSFMKGSAATTALQIFNHSQLRATSKTPLPSPPTLSSLASDRISHVFRDLYSTPAAQNEWGYLKATKSVSGLTAISFPPYACCGIPDTPWSPGYLATCEIFLNGRMLMGYPPPATQVTYTWYPHRIVRETMADGLEFTTHTFMPSRQRAAAQSILVKNPGSGRRDITLGFDLRAAVTRKNEAWFVSSPGEADNRITPMISRGCLIFEAQHSHAVSVQGFLPHPNRVEDLRMLTFDLTLEAGESREIRYVNAIGEEKASASAMYDQLQANFATIQGQNEERFSGLLRSAFTPGNSEFSGHLPRLVTEDESLWKLYHAGFTNLLFARRASPDSAYGNTYLTLGGRVLPTLSFPWDTSLTSLSLALLDPDALRGLIEVWFLQDMHAHLATDYISGHAVGPWYAVNDMAILRCAENYLRVSGDFAWLQKPIGDKKCLEHLIAHALYWKTLDKRGTGLADYGGIENLLEVVSTYIHEVAGMNAGNVSGMRFVAQLLDRSGDPKQASQLRSEAKDLADRINRLLYVHGKGYWRAGQPDGSFNEIRHCYDLLSVFDNMFEDLSEGQKKEMSQFFWSELHSSAWMQSLSSSDADATWNIRPDHSSIGAYPAWPAMTAKGLYKVDPPERVATWVKHLALAGNQGPFGQAHFIEAIFPTERGGAYKSPEDAPYLNDWCCVSGGSFVDLVINSIFGADLTLYDGIKQTSRVTDFDAAARLINLNYQGQNYAVSHQGARRI
jgi:hypothetical protein